MYELPYDVKEDEVDPLYRHVDHSRILKILERARLRLLADLGCSSESLIAEGIFPVISAMEVQYKREVLLERVTATCDSFIVEGRTLRIRQRILNGKGKVAVTAIADSMFMSGATRRGLEIPERLIKALESRLGSDTSPST